MILQREAGPPPATLHPHASTHTATLLPSGKVLVAAGLGNGNDLSSAELYDPTTGSWSSTASLETARRYHTATLLLPVRCWWREAVLVATGSL